MLPSLLPSMRHSVKGLDRKVVIAADVVIGAATLLQHWLRHYTDLGFGREQMLLLVHSNSNGAADPRGACSAGIVMAVLSLSAHQRQIRNSQGGLGGVCRHNSNRPRSCDEAAARSGCTV